MPAQRACALYDARYSDHAHAMNQDTVVNLASQAMSLALKIAGPLLIVALVAGLAVSIFQAVTQIQEQSLTLIPKIIGVAAVMIVLGPWMLGQLVAYTTALYTSIPSMVGS
ncbi:MAG TPA: flagellar biosynthesis protein FliQ [Solirubrobacteraceae bacterium]|nr:flagellar biosynthesis protein FliQ [Solirubrobacteraceae bacterium]